MSPARLSSNLCTPTLVNPLLVERVVAVRKELMLHLGMYLRTASGRLRSPLISEDRFVS